MKQNRGNLAPDSPVPFKGESRAQREHNLPKKTGAVEKIVPFDMVSFSNRQNFWLDLFFYFDLYNSFLFHMVL